VVPAAAAAAAIVVAEESFARGVEASRLGAQSVGIPSWGLGFRVYEGVWGSARGGFFVGFEVEGLGRCRGLERGRFVLGRYGRFRV
jgi:hypothetical protein